MRLWKVIRWFVAALLLLWSGSPAFQAPIDDLYITTAFSHELVTAGRLQWTTGEVVEGVTSIPWTILIAGGPLLGIDAALWARGGSTLVALLLLGALSRRAAPGFGGTLLLWVTAGWTSFSLWALSGFEMTLFASLVALGWTATLERRWRAGIAFLVLAATVRPEGWALALAASGLSWRETRTTSAIGWVITALVAWSLARFAVFGAVLPTPFLVKFVANPRTMAGAAQVAGDLAVAMGPLCAVWLSKERRLIAILPLLLGAALLVISDGDWFAAGRMTATGILTLVYVVAPRVTLGAPGGALLIACGAISAFMRAPYGYSLIEPPLASLPERFEARRAPIADAYGSGFRTPLLQELTWMVQRVDSQSCLLTADVGLLGNVDDVCIRDRVGLVDRAFAEFNAGFAEDPRALSESDDIVAERIIWRDIRPVVGGMTSDAIWPPESPGGWTLEFWRRPEASTPSPQDVVRRWRTLADRYPWQAELWWGWGVFAAEAGQADIVSTIRDASWRWPRHSLATEAESMVSFADRRFLREDYVPGRGFSMGKAGERQSRPVRDDALSLVVDADNGPVTLLVGWSGEDCPLERSIVRTTGGAFALPPAPCPTGRVSVWYIDDEATEGDRNAYVRLREQRAQDGVLPMASRTDVPLEGQPQAEWIGGRGWAMWWNRTLRTPVLPAGASIAVDFDVDAPGEEGARAALAWEPPCGEATETIVKHVSTVELRAPCLARLVIGFENDSSTPEDRNLYVGVHLQSQ